MASDRDLSRVWNFSNVVTHSVVLVYRRPRLKDRHELEAGLD